MSTICLTIFFEMMYSSLLYGGSSKSSFFGGSVANANDAKESIIILTHSNWIGFNGDSLKMHEPMNAEINATTLTVSWNWRNFLMFAYIFLPHMHAFTIDEKLSSSRIMSAACFATSVPVIPIANPTSAFLSAGASFVPSPVTATVSPICLIPVTRRYLSSGLDLARTSKFFQILMNSCSFFTISLTSPSGQSQGIACLQLSQISPPTLW
mmetsp:Transcript_39123/g.44778  ORF Transcript_39123/g.44778 Transcript_39123/m.44778 type:complete len:210 (-) Transcript_39123:1258-1887(-)